MNIKIDYRFIFILKRFNFILLFGLLFKIGFILNFIF
jgi:hypothetical protein